MDEASARFVFVAFGAFGGWVSIAPGSVAKEMERWKGRSVIVESNG